MSDIPPKIVRALTTEGSDRIVGADCGPFVIHRNGAPTFIDDDERFLWSVTHVATGVRFPWSFMTEEAATLFAEDVFPLMNWSAVGVSMDKPGEPKSKWVIGAPTEEESAAVKLAAARRGGIRIANRIPRSGVAA